MLLTHDLGTTGDKATLVADDGTLIASRTVSYPVRFAGDGTAEQDPGDWWRAFVEATRALLDRQRIDPTSIEAVSFSGQMMGVVGVDDVGEPVRPAIIWADTRSTAQCDRLIAEVGMERGYAITGHRLNPTYSLTKIMWLRDNEPDSYAKIKTVLQAKDFLALKLTGVRATDPSDASSTNAYDQRAGSWSEELIEAADVQRSIFPEIVASTDVVGTVTRQAAEETGLTVGTRVVMGGGDGPMAALGAGIIDAASGAYAYLGSSSWVSVSADQPLHDPQLRTMTFNHVLPGRFVPTATMQTGGAALQWVTEVLEPRADNAYRLLLAEAVEASASEHGLFFLPHLLGERSPYWNPLARAAFVGLQMNDDRAAMVRAVLEGVAFNLYTGLLAFIENGVAVSTVDAIGGAANAGLLLDVFADVWGVPVTSRELVSEAGAIGAAVVAGLGVGVFSDPEVARSISGARRAEASPEHRPDPGRHRRYQGEYAQFLDGYRALEPWFETLRR
ncbi:xylulokinase [Microlunatus soli]|uniref:Xylulose kinase n=1 Tax=Microlunatus soli TaxID=630515 RepID=A0A1H1PXX5_9ACTN|nr:xylulokinase [Microlunatus soli]SDS15549.1 xylulokinase [Microlunatus soli]